VSAVSSSPVGALPDADAEPDAVATERLAAVSEMSPAASISRASSAMAPWLAMVRPSPTPTAAEPAAAADAPAVVPAVASWVAVRVSEPVSWKTPDAAVPTRASVVMLERMIAIAGVMAMPPEPEPPPEPPPVPPPVPPVPESSEEPVADAPMRASTEATVRAEAVSVTS
jgi:translation initiation factor IF-2